MNIFGFYPGSFSSFEREMNRLFNDEAIEAYGKAFNEAFNPVKETIKDIVNLGNRYVINVPFVDNPDSKLFYKVETNENGVRTFKCSTKYKVGYTTTKQTTSIELPKNCLYEAGDEIKKSYTDKGENSYLSFSFPLENELEKKAKKAQETTKKTLNDVKDTIKGNIDGVSDAVIDRIAERVYQKMTREENKK